MTIKENHYSLESLLDSTLYVTTFIALLIPCFNMTRSGTQTKIINQ